MNSDNFWKTVKLWSQKAHVVNKRLVGIVPVTCWKLESTYESWADFVSSILEHFINVGTEEEIVGVADDLQWSKSHIWTEELASGVRESSNCYVSLRKCLPKQPRRHSTVYELELIESNPRNDDRGQWILANVLPKLNQWLAEIDDGSRRSTNQTLRLVSLEDYNDLYHHLKSKYVPELMTLGTHYEERVVNETVTLQIWPECTDAQKFIHEDVAIAAYLILVWRQDSKDLKLPEDHRQSFLDIGCGNGLLVFLLSSEGYPGCGLDIRARKLWSMYPPHVTLKVETLKPTEHTAFPQYDWLLGNHSDELTPWLPVMALNSSIQRASQLERRYPTRFWVLPCCPYSFWGKFQREKFVSSAVSSSALPSRYAEYLHFVELVGRTCGFDVEVDRMRIPSTRRTCLVGKSCPRLPHEWQTLYDAVAGLMARESHSADGFQPRAAVQPVKNCTKIDRLILDKFVELTARHLLEAGADEHRGQWNKGGSLLLSELVALMGGELADLRVLKSECGGVQTLLRNHSHIFVVQNQSVRFRLPEELSAAEWRALQKPKKMSKVLAAEREKAKTRPCWFHAKHPQGCPLSAESCRYLHQ
nr:EOG090X07W1 [Sida crystallina]